MLLQRYLQLMELRYKKLTMYCYEQSMYNQ